MITSSNDNDNEKVNEGNNFNFETIQNLIGKKFFDNKNEEVKNLDEIYNSKLIALFFSASWCSPCRIFEKELIDIYQDVNQGEKNFEVIQISLEKSEDVFRKWIVNKPWKFIHFNDNKSQELCTKFNVLNVPMLFVFNHNGKLITETGRKELNEEGVAVVDKWLNM
jgi:nucleoredoxin